MVWHGIRRIFGFALPIHDGIGVDQVEPYLRGRAWLTDAARLLDTPPEALAAELIVRGVAQGRDHPPRQTPVRRRRARPGGTRIAANPIPPRLARNHGEST
jgi:hypothetical protein